MPTSLGPTCTRSTIATESPRDETDVHRGEWQYYSRHVLQSDDLRSNLRAPIFFWGTMPPDLPSVCMLTHAPLLVLPQSQVPFTASVYYSLQVEQ